MCRSFLSDTITHQKHTSPEYEYTVDYLFTTITMNISKKKYKNIHNKSTGLVGNMATTATTEAPDTNQAVEIGSKKSNHY